MVHAGRLVAVQERRAVGDAPGGERPTRVQRRQACDRRPRGDGGGLHTLLLLLLALSARALCLGLGQPAEELHSAAMCRRYFCDC